MPSTYGVNCPCCRCSDCDNDYPGQCDGCFTLGDLTNGELCCIDRRSIANLSLTGLSFDLSGIADATQKTEMASILAWLGSTNAGDVWSGNVTQKMYRYNSDGNWRTCSTIPQPPSPLTLLLFNVAGPINGWDIFLQVNSTSGNTYLIQVLGSPTWDWNCCGGTATVTLRFSSGTAHVDAASVEAEVGLANNRCCNCRGTVLGYELEDGSWVGQVGGGGCGPTSDGSVSTCGEPYTGIDHNSLPDCMLTDNSKRNMCSAAQDADCLDTCWLDPAAPDLITVNVGGDLVPLHKRHSGDGSCPNQYYWSYEPDIDGGSYHYTFSYDFDEEVCDEYNEDGDCISSHIETVHTTVNNNVGAIRIYPFGGPYGGCAPTISDPFCFQMTMESPDTGGCYAIANGNGSWSDPRGTYYTCYGVCAGEALPSGTPVTVS